MTRIFNWLYRHTLLECLNLTLLPFCSDEACYRKNPKISDTGKFAVIILKAEQDGFSLEDAEGIANSVDPDTNLGLHCLPRPVCQKT